MWHRLNRYVRLAGTVLVAAGGKVFLTGEDGDILVIKGGREYELLATNSMNAICMATPAIADGQLFVRTKSHLYCIAE